MGDRWWANLGAEESSTKNSSGVYVFLVRAIIWMFLVSLEGAFWVMGHPLTFLLRLTTNNGQWATPRTTPANNTSKQQRHITTPNDVERE
jgi:hypothetical protein